jgi:hypothetical protein
MAVMNDRTTTGTRMLLAAVTMTYGASAVGASDRYFRIDVIDEQTGRGVPMVELSTTTGERYFTDSNGLVALDAPELMGREVWLHIASHGYTYPADGFGFRGVKLTPKAGERATLKIKRLNVAERLYRLTGAGIYRDAVLLGERPPIEAPLLNAEVAGQDSVLAAVYKEKIFWVWGDTARLRYPLGHFATAGATSELPGRGGLDPAVGVNYRYFTDDGGFSKGLVPLDRPGLVWTDGLLSINDAQGNERLFAHYVRMKNISTLEETGYVAFNDEKERFEVVKQLNVDTPLMAGSHPFHVNVNGEEYLYFPGVYPRPEAYAHIRVKANWESLLDPKQYEGFTCLRRGSRYDRDDPPLEFDDAGKLVWAWKRNTPSLNRMQLGELIEAGRIKRDECPVRFVDTDSGEPLAMNGGSIAWNEYRKRWVLITVNALPDRIEGGGGALFDAPGGDVYFAEANAPEGPWVYAKKIATHRAPDDNYDFYNPVHHGFFDQEGGRIIYFEGTLSTYFSKNRRAVPRYSYNQLMYRLDLSDPRLKLPAPPRGLSDVRPH